MVRFLKRLFQRKKRPEDLVELHEPIVFQAPIPKPKKRDKIVLGSPGLGLHRVNLPNGMILYSSWYKLPLINQLEPLSEIRRREAEYSEWLKEKKEREKVQEETQKTRQVQKLLRSPRS